MPDQDDTDKYCPMCSTRYTTENRTTEAAALEHWLAEHPNADTLHEILASTHVQVECTECGQAFDSPVSAGAGRIAADSCCPDCVADDEFRTLYVQALSPAELLAKQTETEDATERDYQK